MATERDKAYCGAKKHQGEGTCHKEAGWGTDHVGIGPCKLHAGCTPNVSKSARMKLAEIEAAKELARLDVVPVDNPLTELSKLAGQVIAWRDAIAELVNDLTDIRYESAGGGEQLRAEVALFERAMDRCIAVLTAIARLNIDERLLKISERQADAVIAAIETALNAAEVRDQDLRSKAKQAAARHLQQVA